MKLSVKQSLQSSFRVFRENTFEVLMLSVLSVSLLILVQYILGFITMPDQSMQSLSALDFLKNIFYISILSGNISFISQSLVVLFLTNAFLPAFKCHKVILKDYFPDIKKICIFILGLILFLAIPTMCSFLSMYAFGRISPIIPLLLIFAVLVITPIVSVRYFFFYIELLNGYDLITSLKKCAAALKGNFFSLLGLIIVLFLVNTLVFSLLKFFRIIMSMFALFTLPMTVLILTDVYNQMTNNSVKKDSLLESNEETQV